MKMFMFSLKDDARDWYFSLPTASISTLREFHVAFNLNCKRYYSYEFLFHDFCVEYEKSVQVALSFSLDCEVEEDNLVKENNEGSMISSSCSSVLDADSNDSSYHNTSTSDQICNGFSLIFPHLFIVISTKAENFFSHYIHNSGVHGNIDEIISPRVITIKVG